MLRRHPGTVGDHHWGKRSGPRLRYASAKQFRRKSPSEPPKHDNTRQQKLMRLAGGAMSWCVQILLFSLWWTYPPPPIQGRPRKNSWNYAHGLPSGRDATPLEARHNFEDKHCKFMFCTCGTKLARQILRTQGGGGRSPAPTCGWTTSRSSKRRHVLKICGMNSRRAVLSC